MAFADLRTPFADLITPPFVDLLTPLLLPSQTLFAHPPIPPRVCEGGGSVAKGSAHHPRRGPPTCTPQTNASAPLSRRFASAGAGPWKSFFFARDVSPATLRESESLFALSTRRTGQHDKVSRVTP